MAKDSGDKKSSARNEDSIVGSCGSRGCKNDMTRLGFCEDHFDQFKFGLIKKNGEPVPDFDKKYTHYMKHLEKRGIKKVA